MLSTINVSSMNGNAQAGILDSLGKVGNERIQLLIYVQQWSGLKSIKYKISAKDLTTGAKKEIISGAFGNYASDEWKIDNNVTVGMMRTGDDFWFYVEGYPGFVNWTSISLVKFIRVVFT